MGSIKINTQLKQEQGMILTLAMREALTVLEMPTHDLALWIQKQIEQNPALQFEDEYEQKGAIDQENDGPSWIEGIAAPSISLRDHLLAQGREALTSPEDLREMEFLIDSLNDKGFLESSGPEHLVELLQSFDPPGIGAENLRHSLLLQLEEKESLAYRIIHDHYDDFIHRRDLPFPKAQIQEAIKTLSRLSLNPAAPFRESEHHPQTPDIFIEGTTIRLSEAFLPKFKLDLSPELGRFEASARWIEKVLSRRSEIMLRIAQLVVKRQVDFFEGRSSDLAPLSFKEVASELSLNESTISRAVKEKVVSCAQGIFPLRYFFPHKVSEDGPSHHTAKERLKCLIERECKEKPLSDRQLHIALKKQGIECARRTVTKYRQSLKIPPASRRK